MAYEYSPVVMMAHELGRPLPTVSPADEVRSARVRTLIDSIEDGSYQAPDVLTPLTRRIAKGAAAVLAVAGVVGGIAYMNHEHGTKAAPTHPICQTGVSTPRTTLPHNPAEAYMVSLNEDNQTRDLLCH